MIKRAVTKGVSLKGGVFSFRVIGLSRKGHKEVDSEIELVGKVEIHENDPLEC